MTDLSIILRPNGAGYYTTLDPHGLPDNWDCVNEEVLDINTYVTNIGTGYRDLYTLTDPVGASGSITSVTLYAYCKRWTSQIWYFTPYLRTNSQNKTGVAQTLGSGWVLYYQTYTVNPATSASWTWSEMESLQAGLQLTTVGGPEYASCAQLWVEILFAPIPSGRAQLIGLT